MKYGRRCPDCGSPYEGNPCWFSTIGGGDRPCESRAIVRAEEVRTRWRAAKIALGIMALVAILVALLNSR